MLKNSVLKVFMIMLVIIALLIPVTVYADDAIQIIAPTGTTTASPSPAAVTPASPTVVAIPKTTATEAAKVVATPKTTNLPQTEIEDYTGIIVAVVILAGTAVVALKKIKEYKQF